MNWGSGRRSKNGWKQNWEILKRLCEDERD